MDPHRVHCYYITPRGASLGAKQLALIAAFTTYMVDIHQAVGAASSRVADTSLAAVAVQTCKYTAADRHSVVHSTCHAHSSFYGALYQRSDAAMHGHHGVAHHELLA